MLVGALAAPERLDFARSVLKEAGAQETKLATQAQAKQDLSEMNTVPEHHPSRETTPRSLVRNLCLAFLFYVILMGACVWFFLRPA